MRVLQQSETVVALGTPLIELGDTQRLEIVAELLTADALAAAPGRRRPAALAMAAQASGPCRSSTRRWIARLISPCIAGALPSRPARRAAVKEG